MTETKKRRKMKMTEKKIKQKKANHHVICCHVFHSFILVKLEFVDPQKGSETFEYLIFDVRYLNFSRVRNSKNQMEEEEEGSATPKKQGGESSTTHRRRGGNAAPPEKGKAAPSQRRRGRHSDKRCCTLLYITIIHFDVGTSISFQFKRMESGSTLPKEEEEEGRTTPKEEEVSEAPPT